MIGASYLVTRLGLSLGSYALPLLIGGLLSAGGVGAWLSGWTDYKSAILLVVTIGLVAYLVSTNSTWGRIGAAIVIAGACYFKGRIDEGLETQTKVTTAVNLVHAQYKEVSDAEAARQAAVAAEALRKSLEEKLTWDAERQRIRDELQRLNKEAANDKDAARDAFSIDAIHRINRLRFDRKPAAPRNLSLQAQPTRSPIVDAPPMSTPPEARPQ